MLEIKDLHVHYGGIHAVQGVSMRIPQGRIVTLIGANGAGKSSVIRSISGLVKDTKGEVLFTPAARDGSGPRTEQLLGKSPEDIIRRGISVSPEGRRILPHLTVEENLMLGARTSATTRKGSRRTSTGSTTCSRGSGNAAGRKAARSPAANSRCSPWAARS